MEMHEVTQNSAAGTLANWRTHVPGSQLLPQRNESSLLPDVNFFEGGQKSRLLCDISRQVIHVYLT